MLASCGSESDTLGLEPDSAEKPAVAPKNREAPKPEPIEDAPCPPDLAGCVSAKGVIAAVERIDPDGDGDAHFVLADQDSVTLPGFTIIDVAAPLRPRPLPKVGEMLSGAGLVKRGSYGQRQIEAVEIRVEARPPRSE